MKRLKWMLCQPAWRAGALAALLLLAGLVAELAVLEPTRQQLAQARRQLVLVAQARETPAEDPELPWEEEARRQLDAFYAHLGGAEGLPGMLAALHQAAEAEGLVLQRADYRLVRDPQDRLMRYQIAVPVSGPYPGVRGFIARVLERMPAMALDQVAFERRQIAEGRVDARLRFTFHLVQR